jgi:hypothetical protein
MSAKPYVLGYTTPVEAPISRIIPAYPWYPTNWSVGPYDNEAPSAYFSQPNQRPLVYHPRPLPGKSPTTVQKYIYPSTTVLNEVDFNPPVKIRNSATSFDGKYYFLNSAYCPHGPLYTHTI